MWSSGLDHDFSTRDSKELFRAVGHNTGNAAFVHAIRKLINHSGLKIDWSGDELGEIDLLVFPAANQLGSHTNLGDLAENLTRRGKPLVVVGLGAQSPDTSSDVQLSPGTRKFLEVIHRLRPSSNPNIWTRGPYSTNQIKRLIPNSDSIAGCCPSLFVSPHRRLGQLLSHRSGRFQKVAVAGGNLGFRGTRGLEQDLSALVSDALHPGIYVTQSGRDSIQLGLDSRSELGPEETEKLRVLIQPNSSAEEFRVWARSYARVFFDARSWMLELSNYDVVAGARFHGVALGVQAGIPGIVFGFDSRTLELAQTACIPVVEPQECSYISRRALEDFWKRFDPVDFDKNRITKAREFYNFCIGNGLTPSDHFKQLLSE